MLRITALLAVFAASLAACTSGTADNASLALGNDGGTIQLILDRADPSHQFGTLTATINGIALDAPSIAPGGCSDNFFDGGEDCHDADAIYQMASGGLGSSSADVTVTEDGETFHFVAADFFAPRALAVQTSLDTPLVAGGTITVSDGVAGDQLQGWFSTDMATANCFLVTATGSGSLSFALDATDFDAECDTVAPGTIVRADMDLTVAPSPAPTTCDGPDNLSCASTELELEQTGPIELQF